MGLHTLEKAERLYLRKNIQELFKKGSSFYLYPFKVLYLVKQNDAEHHEILISVSKRNFKKAVDRNTIKRRTKESYRLHKSVLNLSPKIAMAFIYVAKEIHPSTQIQAATIQALSKINEKLVKQSNL